MILLVVESPTKGRTISRFLGKNYKVVASFGHVRDLPKRELGVDVEKNFEPKYVIPTKAKKVIAELKKEAKLADEVILATDQDREGESISWHLAEALNLKDPKRIVFHEITKSAIAEALKTPGKIDMHLVDAQQARRVLDRIVGYKLSPFLWKKISKGLSAGRVQSVAVRLVVEREEEIKKFIAEEYWEIEAIFNKENKNFSAFLIKKDGKIIDKLEIKNKKHADEILVGLENAKYQIEKITKKETKRNPLPPFTTSTMQQTAANKFHFTAKMTMSVAQKLYEQGHITYHRTDSLNLSQSSLIASEEFIKKSFGNDYFKGTLFKAKGNAQEAHEAIRPTYADKTPESMKSELEGAQLKLYTLIWQRFIASQMTPAIFDSTSIEINGGNGYIFGANGQMLKFDGFLKIYPMKFSENEMPKLQEKEILELVKINPSQHYTEPPSRYNEASLIKALESHGIGRPSTYAPTLSTIQDRNYIAKNEQKRFAPTEMGTIVNEMLVKNFPQIVDIEFTAKMEKGLDEIAEGKDVWEKIVGDFYGPFAKNLKEKYDEIPKEDLTIKTDKKCPKCGKDMVDKMGRFGRFYACTGFPDCKHTESIIKDNPGAQAIKIDIICPKCKKGQVVAKKTRRGKIFYGCDDYPKCDFAAWDKPINEFCPTCGLILVETKSKKVKCSSKDCDFKKEEA
ncbi:MAG: topoisomerase protein [Parcubacteria group bacterium GW2011_GWA1_33_6]|nr:MAG: topoisomerase protein [Parcubacteria group bacterium GW2011_GWA1_33_6]